MQELLRTNDIVLISAVGSLLAAADIPHHVADGHMSVLEGSLGLLPRRLVVADEDAIRARRLLNEAGFGDDLVG
ncbi:putative signal transducing protein [Ancylobacter lacus]|uniref:putative signal transducing protein n=1 Tax=Ancylobacter lacus TaxID=2579970 RepID=UPI001BCD1839|nr:DUF2007 domain-containing protein [Ancylobacter lacus]MBS7540522.1 DUF2007 domain-containing protein [Ancylobacter lacus]